MDGRATWWVLTLLMFSRLVDIDTVLLIQNLFYFTSERTQGLPGGHTRVGPLPRRARTRKEASQKKHAVPAGSFQVPVTDARFWASLSFDWKVGGETCHIHYL